MIRDTVVLASLPIRRILLVVGVIVIVLAPALDIVMFGIHQHLTGGTGAETRLPGGSEPGTIAVHECEHSSNAWAMSSADARSPLNDPESLDTPGRAPTIDGISDVPAPPPRSANRASDQSR